jgi:hypothetical protein
MSDFLLQGTCLRLALQRPRAVPQGGLQRAGNSHIGDMSRQSENCAIAAQRIAQIRDR